MHDIEREIIKITKYKVQRKFADRQDYLKSLFTAVQKLSDDDFDELTDDAAVWANACVEAHNSQRDGDLPDFDEVGEDADDEEDAGDDELDPEDEESDDDDASDDKDEALVDDDGHENGDDRDSVAAVDDEKAADAQDNDEEVEVSKPAKKGKGASKPAKKVVAAPKVKEKPEPKIKQKPVDLEEDVVLDKWGCMEGSKNSQALGMFEKGATAKEIKDAIGGTYYNILRKMVEQGHKLEKNGAVMKLTHMMEKPTKAAPAKKAKK